MNNQSTVKMKDIMIDNVVVGQIKTTGDHDKDLAAAEEFLKAKGLWRQPELSDSMFNQAFSFSSVARKINHEGLQNLPRDAMSITPFVVNATFSIEIYLKSIHILYGQKKTGHLLMPLFEQLPDEAKTVISIKSEELIKEYNFSTPIEFEKELETINKAFEQWRYIYEKSNLKFIHTKSVIFIMNVLHETYKVIRDNVNKASGK